MVKFRLGLWRFAPRMATLAIAMAALCALAQPSSAQTLDLAGKSLALPKSPLFPDAFLSGGAGVTNSGANAVLTEGGGGGAATAFHTGSIADGAGTVGLTHTSGVTVLAGSNSYSGDTNINGGVLQAGSAAGLSQNSLFYVNVGGTLDIHGFDTTIGALISDGAVTNGGASAATLTIGNLNYNTTFAGTLADGGASLALTKIGAGTLTLAGQNSSSSAGQNTYSGITTISAGALQLGDGNNIGTVGAGAIFNNAALIFNQGADYFNQNNLFTLNNSISGSGSLTQQGPGTVILAGANSYTGGTFVDGSNNTRILLFASAGAIPATGGITLTNAGAAGTTYALDQAFLNNIVSTSTGAVVLGADSGNALNFDTGGTAGTGLQNVSLGAAGPCDAQIYCVTRTYSGALTPWGAAAGAPIYMLGGGNAVLNVTTSLADLDTTSPTSLVQGANNTQGFTVLSGANSYLGGTTIQTGILQFNSANAIPNAGTPSVVINPFAIAAAGYAIDQTFLGSIVATSQGTVALATDSSSTLDFNAANLANVSLGAVSNASTGTSGVTFSGALLPYVTPGTFEGTYNLGGGGYNGSSTSLYVTSLLSNVNGSSTDGTNSLLVNAAGYTTAINVVLLNNETYSGQTIVDHGTLSLGNFATVGNILFSSGVVLRNADSTLLFNEGSPITFDRQISGQGSLEQAGPSTVTLTNAETYTGNTYIFGSTLALGAGGSIADSALVFLFGGMPAGSLDISAGGDQTVRNLFGDIGASLNLGANRLTIGVAGAAYISDPFGNFIHGQPTQAFAGSITGGGGLTFQGTSAYILYGSSTYSGDTLISAGTLKGGASNTFSAFSTFRPANGATLDLGGFSQSIGALADPTGGTGGTVTNNGAAAAVLTTGGNGASTSFSGVLQDGASALGLTKVGAGVFTLSGANTYSGATLVSAGTLRAGADNSFSANSATTISSGGVLDLGGFSQTITSVALSGGVLQNGNLNGAIVSAGGTVNGIGGAATLTLGSGATTLSGANTYSGATTVNGGTLLGGSVNSFSSQSSLFIGAAGTVDLGGHNQTVGALSGAGVITTSTLAATLTIGGNNASGTFSGTIVDGAGAAISLIKTGSGVQLLSGGNIYTGATTINAGTLAGGASNTFSANSAITVNFGATLDLGGFAQTISSVSLNGGTIQNGSLTGAIASDMGTVNSIGGLASLKTYTGATVLLGSNSYSGATNVGARSILLGGSLNAFSSASALIVAGTVDLGGFDQIGGSLSGGGRVTNSGPAAAALTIGADNGSASFSGVIADGAGAVSLIKAGTGAQILSGVSTYSGSTTIFGGVLQIGVANALPQSTVVTIGPVGTLALNGFNQTVGSLAGTGAVSLGAGQLTTGGANTSTAFAGGISGSGGIVKTGSGIFALSGANTYSGLTTITGGTLLGGANNAFSAASATLVNKGATLDLGGFAQTINTVRLNGGTIQNGGLIGAIFATSGIVNTIGGPASLTVNGGTNLSAGITTLIGANSYAGATIVNGGTLLGGSLNAFSAASALAVASGANADLGGFNQSAGSLAGAGVVTNTGAAATLTIGGDNTSTSFSGVLQDGGGALSLLKTGSGVQTLAGLSTYSGATSITGGTLRIGLGNALPQTTAVTVGAAGTLALNGFNQTIGSLTGSGAVSLGAGQLTTGGDNSSTTFSGVISGAGSLVKAGSGAFTLTGVNTYSSKTWIQSGTLAVNNGNALGAGPINMSAGATLAFLGTGYTLANNIQFVGASFTDPSFDTGAGVITLSGVISGQGDLSKLGAGALILTGVNTYSGNTFADQGTLQVDGSIAASPLTTVAAGATLSGIGAVGNITALSGATVSPGNAGNVYGALTATGAVTLQSGATLLNNVSPAAASKLAVNGSATITGARLIVNALNSPNYVPGSRYALLTATSGVTGTFASSAVTPISGFRTLVTYDPNNVFLNFQQILTQAQANASVQRLAGDRLGQMVTNRNLAMVLGAFNEQINCSDCVSGFGSIGSFSAGVHGRKTFTNDLSLIAGAAYANYHSGGADVTSAPIFAGALRYDVTEHGWSRPFGEIGVFATPSERVTYTRTYSDGTTTWNGVGKTNASNYSAFGKLGWVWRISPIDEASTHVEYSRSWQRTGGYSESTDASNPVNGVVASGTDRMDLVKLGAQWTHLWKNFLGANIETQGNLGLVHSFSAHSGLVQTFASNGSFAGQLADRTWVEYGARIGYRLPKGLVVDAFADGTLGGKPIGNTVHFGLGLRYIW